MYLYVCVEMVDFGKSDKAKRISEKDEISLLNPLSVFLFTYFSYMYVFIQLHFYGKRVTQGQF